MKHFFLFIVLVSQCFFYTTKGLALTASEELNVALAESLILSTTPTEKISDIRVSLNDKDQCLTLIYTKRGIKPLWVTDTGPTPRANIILDFLKASDDEGLNQKDYNVNEINSLWLTKSPASLARLDTLLTYNLLKYIHDVSHSQIDPPLSDFISFSSGDEGNFDIVKELNNALTASDLKVYLASLPPSNSYYQGLKNALKTYRSIALNGGWKQIPPGNTLRPGETDTRLPLIYKRMSAPGLPPVPPLQDMTYGPDLQQAVMKFQQLNGLPADGVIGQQTLVAMNVPASHLVEQIIVNMARWRWQSHDLGHKYVMINIADFSLTAVKNNVPILSFPVIIGQLQHQTPVFSDSIKYIEFNPYWNITTSIAKNEELPNLRKNPRYLVDRHVRLFSGWEPGAVELDSSKMDWRTITPSRMAGFRLRQDPGPWNALGRIKFGFPNKYAIYMHDTPTKDLFSRSKRDFSHGCIRLSNPVALAIFSLEDQEHGWSKEKVESHYISDKRIIVRLDPPLPIHITYQTTWVDKDGFIHFNRDIYDRDQITFNSLVNSNDKILTAVNKKLGEPIDKLNQ